MLHYSVDKIFVAGYVRDLMNVFEKDLRSITITLPEKSEDCSVLIATSSSLVETVKAWTQDAYGWQLII